ncbi:MAG: hypothetical protein LBT09_12585 [Planctomycetaceae bacterium]|jgi:hypothetical protein|nr:hypothetical protein [Planctomycetaceae bacterium]
MVYDEDPELRMLEIVDKMLPEIHKSEMQDLLNDVLNYGRFTTPNFTDEISEKIIKYIETKGDIKMPVCLYDKIMDKLKKAEAEKKQIVAEKLQSDARAQKIENEKLKIVVEKMQIEAEKNEFFREACDAHVKAISGFLRYRFGEVSDEVWEKLQKINELVVLRELADYVEVCPTADDFKKKIAGIKIQN